MKLHRTAEEIEAAAKRYEVSTRTIHRWISAGVNIDHLESVANYLLRQRSPKPETLQTVQELIQ